ncbi:uncharacterized protein [Mytilus edulis]|uniref:uncharacterized protein n=1 Tax=Mytilus edulis TaxID=6550 RepID=UPI0039F041AD
MNFSWRKNIKDVRNFLAHHENGQVGKSDFEEKWKLLEMATLGFASELGSKCLRMFTKEIAQIKSCSIEVLKQILKESNNSLIKMFDLKSLNVQLVHQKQDENDKQLSRIESSIDKNIQLPWLVGGEEFHRMLSYGEYRSYEHRLSLGGPCRAGKSTLASVLIGEQIPLQWNSTDGLVIYFGRNGIDIENKKMIPLQQGERGHEILAKILRGKPYVSTESDKVTRIDTQTSVKRTRTEFHSVSTIESPTNSTQDDKEITKYSTSQFATRVSMTESDMEHLSTKMSTKVMSPATTDIQTLDCQTLQLQSDILEEVRNGKYKIKIAPSDIIDFGGQKSYDMTHQLFIQQRGSFLLMFDGRLGLHKQLDEYQERVTAAFILKHWVDSVLTYTEDTEDIMPMILFAATHRDQCQGDIEKTRECFVRDIKHMFSRHDKKHHIHLDTVYFINGIDKNDPEIRNLTDQVVQFAMQQSSWGQRRPMQWVPLDLQISNLRMKNVNIITMEDIQNINKLNADLALTEDQLTDFLLVQHSLGKLMYYKHPGLDKCIIIHPPALVNILRSFVTDEKFFPVDKSLKSILQTLTKTGKINRTDLLKLWQQDHFHQYMKDDSIKEFVIHLLVHLDILIVPKASKQSSPNVYLVPCMIKTTQPDFKNLQQIKERTICLRYSLTQNFIPSALAYKVIGSALINWPLKEEDGKPNKLCLYHKAAVLNVSEDDELHIWVEDNRVMVNLTNKRLLLSISPDVAASIQECLTRNIQSSLLFYFNSFGKQIKTAEVLELYTLALGVPCGNSVCFISANDVNEAYYWTCDRNKKHESKYLLYWIFDKSQTRCAHGCKGLSNDELKTEPSDKHLVRLGSQIGIKSFQDFYLHLGMTTGQWDNTSYMYGTHSCEGIMLMALVKWKESKSLDIVEPSLKDLSDALQKVNLDCHVICQVFREENKLQDIADFDLQKIPNDGVLKELSNQVGNCALQLGIELGVSINEVENSLYKFPKDLPGLIEDILKKWKAKSIIKTFKSLMLALQRVKGGGVKYLHRMSKKNEQCPA